VGINILKEPNTSIFTADGSVFLYNVGTPPTSPHGITTQKIVSTSSPLTECKISYTEEAVHTSEHQEWSATSLKALKSELKELWRTQETSLYFKGTHNNSERSLQFLQNSS
jgi:hypothetical protein